MTTAYLTVLLREGGAYVMMSSRALYLWISCVRTTFSGDGSSCSMELGFSMSINAGIIPRMSPKSPNT